VARSREPRSRRVSVSRSVRVFTVSVRFGHGVDGVGEEVDEDLFDLHAVEGYRRKPGSSSVCNPT